MVNSTLNGEPNIISEIFDPFNFGLIYFPILAMIKVVLTELTEYGLRFALDSMKLPILPSREPPIMKGLVAFEPKDKVFLFINQFIETAMSLQVIKFALYSDKVTFEMDSVSDIVTKMILPLYPMFYINDFLYYFFHYAMHHPALYPYVHKHHHRQALPKRGYWDAANDHPLENFGGQVLIFAGIYATAVLYNALGSQIHGASVLLFLNVFATFAFLNHTPYDVQLPWYLLGYTVRAHETHHRFGRANYSQNTMIYDKSFGTFQVYKSGQKAK